MKPTPARSAKSAQTYWILERRQILCLASARRQDLLDRLVAAGPSSVREFAGAIGLRPSATYHHLRRLEAVGLVRVESTRVVRRRTEKVYAAVAPRMRMARALEHREQRVPVTRVVAAQCRQMQRDFARGIVHEDAIVAGARRNLGFFRMVGSPGRAALAEINRHLDRIAEILWAATNGGAGSKLTNAGAGSNRAPAVALGWTLAPAGSEQSTTKPRRRSSTTSRRKP